MLSVVLGTYNRLDQIRRAIDSVMAETNGPFHLYITDAGSNDGTVEYLESIRSQQVTPILGGKRLGQARAYNQVFETIQTGYVCWLSDDNVVVNRALDKAVAILQQEQSIGMVGLKVRDVIGPFVDAPYIGGMSITGILNVNQGVLPAALFRQLGYFSEEFRDYGIDPDLTARVLLAGKDIVYTRDVALEHYRNWETDKTSSGYADMQNRQKVYLAKYAQTYSSQFPKSVLWTLKRGFYKCLQKGLGVNINSHTKFLGMNGRDWHNCLTGRYISALRELFARNCSYHLRQTPPRR